MATFTFEHNSQWKEAPSGQMYAQAGLTNTLMLSTGMGSVIYLTREDLEVMLAEFPEPPQYGKDTP